MRSLVAIALLGWLVAGCSFLQPAAQGGPYPEACAQFEFTPRRCEAIVVRAAEDAGLTLDEVESISLLPIPEQEPHFGAGIVAVVGLHLPGGRVDRLEIFCPGISQSFDPACGDQATISFTSGVDRDLPCAVGPPEVCATLPPTPPPEAVAAARPFLLGAIDVVIDHPGHYLVRLGAATLPNGYLSERSLAIVDEQPTDYWISGGQLLVRSDVLGRPPVGSIYRDPYDGQEPVTILLEFEVTRYVEPGVLQLRDIAVR